MPALKTKSRIHQDIINDLSDDLDRYRFNYQLAEGILILEEDDHAAYKVGRKLVADPTLVDLAKDHGGMFVQIGMNNYLEFQLKD